MKKGVTIVLILFSMVMYQCAHFRQTPPPQDGLKTKDSLQARIPVLLEEAGIPGLSIAIVKNGKIEWTSGFGVVNTKTSDKVTDSTVFEAASLGKPVFAYAVMRLADQGLLDLNRPIISYLPSGFQIHDSNIRKITALMILSHQSGLPNWRQGPELKTFFEPGERFSYSGEGFDLLQMAVEEILKKPLDECMKELVFVPFAMTRSSYSWLPSYDRLKAYPHNEMLEPGKINRSLRVSAASSLHTTAADFARFVGAALRGEGLKKATSQQMITSHAQIDENCVNCLQQRSTAIISRNISWGLGWGLQQTEKGTALWHWGDNGSFKAYIAGLPNKKDAVVFFANSSNGLSITEEIVQIALGISQPSIKWLTYEPYNTETRNILRSILNGKDQVLSQLQANAKQSSLTSQQYNWIAEQLEKRSRYTEAVALYQLSLQKEPQSYAGNLGLGRIFEKQKNKTQALHHYKLALKAKPDDKELESIIDWLERPAYPVSATTLAGYTGEYDSPIGKLFVTAEEGVLYAELVGQSKEELTALSNTRFYSRGIRGYFTFSGDDHGMPREMLIEVGGQKIVAKKSK